MATEFYDTFQARSFKRRLDAGAVPLVKKSKRTIHSVVRPYLRRHPGTTASKVANATGFKVSSVSSYLKKEVSAGRVRSEPGVGARGGAGYWAVTTKEQRGKTAWERMADDWD